MNCLEYEYKLIKKARDTIPYATVKSKNQIKTIVTYNKGIDAYLRLFELFSKHIRIKDYKRVITKILNQNVNDVKVYNMLSKYIKKYKKSEVTEIKYNVQSLRDCTREVRHAELVYYKLIRTIKDYNFENYLDIGCGDCIKSKLIGNMLGISDKNIYGADIEQWSPYSLEKRKKLPINIVLLKENKKLPFEDNKFSLVSLFMVLHHVKNLELMMKELYRITKDDGFVIIREHDCMTNMDAMLIDIEHGIYDVAYDKDYGFFKNYYAKYYDHIEWDNMFTQNGFEYYGGYGFDSTSAHFRVSPTRYFSTIYRKKKDSK